jgi:integrase
MSRRGRGEGSISLRKDGRWEGRVDLGWHTGKRRRVVVYGATRAEAASKVVVLLRERQQGLLSSSPSQSLSTYLDSWLTSIEGRVRPKTLVSDRMYVRRHILPTLGKLRLDRLTPQHVQALLDLKTRAGLAPQSVVHIRGVLRRALNRAMRYGWVVRNSAALADPPKLERTPIKPFSPDEAREFLDAVVGDPLEGLYSLALTTGLRQGELLGLRWEDVDLDGATVRVNHALQRYGGELHMVPPKTARSRRIVSIPEVAARALRAHRFRQLQDWRRAGDRWQDRGLVFATRWGTPIEPRNATRSFKRVLARVGLREIRFHDLRHSCATLLLVQGVSPRVVMEILGHSQIGLTMNTYSHVALDLQREAAGRMDAVLDPDRVRSSERGETAPAGDEAGER